MRAERVMSLLDLLRATEETNVAALAEQLGVSRRTVLRDLATLRERGVAISSDVGPGGGIRLERDRGAAQVTFADAEIVALTLVAHLARVASGLPWGGAARSGVAKLFAALPRQRARELRALTSRVVVGNAATPRVREGAQQPPAELLGLFERAFTSGTVLAFDYVDREGRASTRLVEPHGLLVEVPVWYILGIDCEKQGARMFRMDRITRPRLVTQQRFRPDLAVVRELTTHVKDQWDR
ncbi:MAG TPA: WYL domain-containing protein [Thermoanaerobaculia bacterium]